MNEWTISSHAESIFCCFSFKSHTFRLWDFISYSSVAALTCVFVTILYILHNPALSSIWWPLDEWWSSYHSQTLLLGFFLNTARTMLDFFGHNGTKSPTLRSRTISQRISLKIRFSGQKLHTVKRTPSQIRDITQSPRPNWKHWTQKSQWKIMAAFSQARLRDILHWDGRGRHKNHSLWIPKWNVTLTVYSGAHLRSDSLAWLLPARLWHNEWHPMEIALKEW